MFNLAPLVALAIVQGLTEFLPVSSSGHLVLLQHWLGAYSGDVFLDVLLHVGTLGSVLCVYRAEIRRLLRFDPPAIQYIAAIVVGTVPAVIIGLLFKDPIERLFASPAAAGAALIFTGLVLFSTRGVRSSGRSHRGEWYPVPPALGRALLIGCAQALAILPGISRSGTTITASLWLKLPRAEAARFSFLLSVPAIAGALVLHLLDGVAPAGGNWIGAAVGALIAFAVGLVAIKLTAMAVIQRHFWKFAFYCLPLGVLVLLLLSRG